jgi:hypothetical protein
MSFCEPSKQQQRLSRPLQVTGYFCIVVELVLLIMLFAVARSCVSAAADPRLGGHCEDSYLQGAASPGQGLVLHPRRY